MLNICYVLECGSADIVVLLQSVADTGMECETSVSVSRVEDLRADAITAVCDLSPTETSQQKLNSSDTLDTGSENEQTPGLEVSGSDGGDGPVVKKPKPEVISIHSSEDEDDSASEPNPEVDSSCGNEDAGGDSKASGGSAKKRKLETASVRSTDDTNSRRRNKSTSAAVLLGLVKSRVRKRATERREDAASSDKAAAVTLSSQTAVAGASSLSTVSNPHTNTPPGERVFLLG